ncbi:MAG: septal ring lytic transglycosylase RlpA family protein [Oleibacter sp.]|nr:septal ring lytic transglycosylase RlpA family protein [Thalassolituus sp.]
MLRVFFTFILATTIAGCSGYSSIKTGDTSTPSGGGGASASDRYQHADDFHPRPIEDIAAIPNAIPLDEPISRMGNPISYQVLGKRYSVLKNADGFEEEGIASWYGMKFHGHKTSNGEVYDVYKMTAAHKNLPLPSYVRVTRTDTGKSVVVRVNDRGPFHPGRIIDLSYAAAVKLGVDKAGTAPVRIKVLKTPLSNNVRWLQVASFTEAESAEQLRSKVSDMTNNKWQVAVWKKEQNGDTLHRVRIGPVDDDDVDRLVNQLARQGYAQPMLLSSHQLAD